MSPKKKEKRQTEVPLSQDRIAAIGALAGILTIFFIFVFNHYKHLPIALYI